jgi:hypothetical protein
MFSELFYFQETIFSRDILLILHTVIESVKKSRQNTRDINNGSAILKLISTHCAKPTSILYV